MMDLFGERKRVEGEKHPWWNEEGSRSYEYNPGPNPTARTWVERQAPASVYTYMGGNYVLATIDTYEGNRCTTIKKEKFWFKNFSTEQETYDAAMRWVEGELTKPKQLSLI